MHIRKLLSLIAGLFLTASLWSQDVHFSQYNMAPISLNPANTGNFLGSIRIGGILRGQWWSVLGGGDQYKTPSVYLDGNLPYGFRKQDWVSIGLMVFQDKAGALGLTHSGGTLSGAYHLGLDKKDNSVLSIGINYGGEQRKIGDPMNAMFADGFPSNGGAYGHSADSPTSNFPNPKYTNIDGGVVLTSKLNKTMSFSVGFAMYHLNKGTYSLIGTQPTNNTMTSTGTPTPPTPGTARIPTRSVLSGQFNIKLSERFTVSPSFFYQTMSGLDEVALQGMGNYLFNPEKEISFDFGLGYRAQDALELLLGFRQKKLKIGLAYDVNTSSLATVSKHQGAFELAAMYIIDIHKPAVVKPKILCPRF
jgi:type IX secretion system PorP/SprF family membrane protein